jgi:cyclophilin family peptidyl-prolyl cis-trans isomerase
VLLAIAVGVGLVAWRPALLGLESRTSPTPPGAAGTNTAPPPTLSTTPDRSQVAALETTAGTIVIEFLPEFAPKHTVAFQNMFRTGFFNGTVFHRVIPKQAIQGGDPNSKDDNPYDDGLGQETQRRIPAEFSMKVHHTRGSVSAAHLNGDPDSATSQFFISTGTNHAWDGQYTIFGRVIEGMDVVDKIASAPLRTDSPVLRERPVDPVRITNAYLAPRESIAKSRASQ